MRGPRLCEILWAHEVHQGFGQDCRRLRKRLGPRCLPPGSNLARAIAATMPGTYLLPPAARAVMPAIACTWRPMTGVDAAAALSATT